MIPPGPYPMTVWPRKGQEWIVSNASVIAMNVWPFRWHLRLGRAVVALFPWRSPASWVVCAQAVETAYPDYTTRDRVVHFGPLKLLWLDALSPTA